MKSDRKKKINKKFKTGLITLYILLLFDSFDIFIIAICGRKSNPNSLPENLEIFLNELNHLLQNGFDFYEKHFNVEVKCFPCDAPARSFLKGAVFQEHMKALWCLIRKFILREMKKGVNNLNAMIM